MSLETMKFLAGIIIIGSIYGFASFLIDLYHLIRNTVESYTKTTRRTNKKPAR